MKQFRMSARVALLAGAAVSLWFLGQSVWLVAGVAVLAALLWASASCRHPRPLALLPPTRVDDGSVAPARWFCSACGASWPAMIEHPRPPVPRFVGHDEAKAAAAAKRAAALEQRTRELAVLRSGAKTPSAASPRRTGPVPVQSRRVG